MRAATCCVATAKCERENEIRVIPGFSVGSGRRRAKQQVDNHSFSAVCAVEDAVSCSASAAVLQLWSGRGQFQVFSAGSEKMQKH